MKRVLSRNRQYIVHVFIQFLETASEHFERETSFVYLIFHQQGDDAALIEAPRYQRFSPAQPLFLYVFYIRTYMYL